MTLTAQDRDADVVVCGAGPVGLTSATLLASRGLTVVVFEQHASTSDEPKAISLDDEALKPVASRRRATAAGSDLAASVSEAD